MNTNKLPRLGPSGTLCMEEDVNKVPDSVVQDLLHSATLRILDTSQWCNYALARNSNFGIVVDPVFMGADRWCAMGSMMRSAAEMGENDITYVKAVTLVDEVSQRYGYKHTAEANDLGGHSVIISILCEALQELGGELPQISPEVVLEAVSVIADGRTISKLKQMSETLATVSS